jgi:osmoprotectant transport system permease protein
MSWVLDNVDLISRLTLAHIRLSVIPILAGALVAIPLGWVAYRFPAVRGFLLTGVGLIYTIPSLALFVLLPPLLGLPFLSPANVIIALSLYAIAIMVRSAADAFLSVDPAILRSATAVGYESWQRVLFVELPLAGPVILAGLRVVAVSTVSLVTVGILVGVQSLGYLFTDGFQRNIEAEILAGIVMTVVVAMVFDGVLVGVGRVLMPWSRALELQATSKQVATR